MSKAEITEEALKLINKTLVSKNNVKLISVIGSCRTLAQLESCKHWIERIVKSPEERTILYGLAAMRFGQIDCGIDV